MTDQTHKAATSRRYRMRWWVARRPIFRNAWRTNRNGLRHRIYALLIERNPWWDWGHRLMILTGSEFGGNWSEPEPSIWWYQRIRGRKMWRTGWPRNQFRIITDYDEFRAIYEPLNDDERYEWKAICLNQDGELHLGHQYWGERFYGLSCDEQNLLRRWLRSAHRHNWYGLRSWLYALGLHAAVHRKKPFTCRSVPPKGQGGYSHWYCQLRRNHDSMHRFNNYTWGEIGGEAIGATREMFLVYVQAGFTEDQALRLISYQAMSQPESDDEVGE